MELTVVHILTFFMILFANCQGGPIKNKIIGKLSAISEEALHADTNTSGDSRLQSFVKSRSKRSNNCEKKHIQTNLDINLRSNRGFSTKIPEIICTCCSNQIYGFETVCLWQNSTCTLDIKIRVRKGCSD